MQTTNEQLGKAANSTGLSMGAQKVWPQKPNHSPLIKLIMPKTNAAGSQVLLVGGFCASPFLQEVIRAKVKAPGATAAPSIIVVDEPYAAVLRGGYSTHDDLTAKNADSSCFCLGAVLYGCNPKLIHARRSRYNYGLRACGPYTPGAPGKFWHEEEQSFFSDSLFSVFSRQGQLISHDETVLHYFVPLYSYQTSCSMELFLVDNPKAV